MNVFFRINQDRPRSSAGTSTDMDDEDDFLAKERSKQEHEFRIGSIGFADSSGILLASIVAMPTEMSLCRAQIARGKGLCAAL